MKHAHAGQNRLPRHDMHGAGRIDPAFTFHGLRHTWASWHVMAGTPLSVLQTLGGWRSLAMVQKYAHLAPDFTVSYAENSARDSLQFSLQQINEPLKLVVSD